MKLSRGTQALIPLLLAPLVALWLDSTGNDKAPVFIIPWMAFAVAYAIAFRLLSPHVKHTLVLTLAATGLAIAGGIALTMLVVGLLKANAGY